MKSYTAVVERDPVTGLYVGFVPGFPGAHSQGQTLDELDANLREVVAMLLEDGEPVLESEFIGVPLRCRRNRVVRQRWLMLRAGVANGGYAALPGAEQGRARPECRLVEDQACRGGVRVSGTAPASPPAPA
jgi:predicted RNase H-like HicB family nuclease